MIADFGPGDRFGGALPLRKAHGPRHFLHHRANLYPARIGGSAMGQLHHRMIRHMDIKGLAPSTRNQYASAITVMVRHLRKTPDQLTRAEVEEYLHGMVRDRGASVATMKMTIAESTQRSRGMASLIP